MQRAGGRVLLSASDLVHFHECTHLTQLDLRELDGEISAPEAIDEHAALIQRKGHEFERHYLDGLEARCPGLARIDAGENQETRLARTLEAMRAGAPVIYQATLVERHFLGHADFLRRVDRPSALGDFSYEVLDTKLARSPKAKFVLQLCFYSERLTRLQGIEPHAMHVALGTGEEVHYRLADYVHYYRRLEGRFLAAVENRGSVTYPMPCAHCALCRWSAHCEAQRATDDHLSLVAGIRADQIGKLERAAVRTVRELAARDPSDRVPRLATETFTKLRAQAALQLRGRKSGCVEFEALEAPAGVVRGLARLPLPDPGDVWFDMEGDPLHEDEGLEYLFGLVYREGEALVFRAFWAHDRDAERRALEEFMDFLAARRRTFPALHVYHYASYEPAALKRLACRHGTRESQLDDLLRRQRFVDLYTVLRQAFRVSEPSYSLKHVELLYRPKRAGEVQTAAASVVEYEKYREDGDPRRLDDIVRYNEDDCRSLEELHRWLLARRPGALPWYAGGADAGESADAEPTAKSLARQQEEAEVEALKERLLAGLPADRLQWDDVARARELTAHLLEFHRRAEKPQWWEMFARADAEFEDLIDDMEAIAGLRLLRRIPGQGRTLEQGEYEYPEQDFKLQAGDDCVRVDTLERVTIMELDRATRRLRLRASRKAPKLPAVLDIGDGGPVGSDKLRAAVRRYAAALVEAALTDGTERYRALTAFLRREPPKVQGLRHGEPLVPPEAPIGAITDKVLRLDHSHLFIQGPPGAGKTYTGSHLIVALLQAGKRVAVSSNSHKAINNLLRAVEDVALSRSFRFRGVKKSNLGDEDSCLGGRMIRDVGKTEEALGGSDLVAGTAWLFADEGADQRFDYLFVDEAGQVSLGHLVAMGTCARNLVLLGDQMQLPQPIQGVHPGRSGDSSLEYLLDGAATVAPDRGIFLPLTWRMHPDLCRFISEAVYDGRLHSAAGCSGQRLVLGAGAHPALRATGLVFRPVEHHGCSQKSEPEAEVIRALHASLLGQQWIDRHGRQRAITADDILVVAPYNVQVQHLRASLPDGARVGTVDKFQGQEAAVVLVSMATSSELEIPRNIEFLFSRNRLNVALSRAKCLAVMVASPRLMDVRCSTAEQMTLVNTLCWASEASRQQIVATGISS